jgi:hypothetical protein
VQTILSLRRTRLVDGWTLRFRQTTLRNTGARNESHTGEEQEDDLGFLAGWPLVGLNPMLPATIAFQLPPVPGVGLAGVS